MTADFHQPVLTEEVLNGLDITEDGYYVDATFGRGGHSRLILQKLGPQGRLLAIDQDPAAVKAGLQQPFAEDPRFIIRAGSFVKLKEFVAEQEWNGKVKGILLDLGLSSPQVDDPSRGFSFSKPGPLDMRMNPQQEMSAATWLNTADENKIAQVLYEYGEERFSRRIARAIVAARMEKPLETTTELAQIIARSMPYHERQKHPATRCFQAIRIFINQELTVLKSCLNQSLEVLAIGGRLGVISFHSLEDRIVKQFIHLHAQGEILHKLPIIEAKINRRLRKVGPLIRPQKAEIVLNPRARSARLRIAEKLA